MTYLGATDQPLEVGALEGVKQIEAEIDAHGWDQYSRLGIFYRREVDPVHLDLSSIPAERQVVLGFMFEYVTIAVFDKGMELIPPAVVIQRLVERVEAHRDRPPPDADFQGWFFGFEAWGVVKDKADTAGIAEATAQASDHRLSTHPDRHKTRGVMAVDIGDTLYTVMRLKGDSDDERKALAEPFTTYRGEIAAALQRLVKVSI